mgnify:CR=1 FL=1
MRKLFALGKREQPLIDPIPVHDQEVENQEWPSLGEEEGQLALDIYQTDDAVIVKSTIAGALASEIEIFLAEGMLTIKGRRESTETVSADAYLYRECYWGRFSRSVILPVEVKSDRVTASLHNGVLTIVLPKVKRLKSTTIRVADDEE